MNTFVAAVGDDIFYNDAFFASLCAQVGPTSAMLRLREHDKNIISLFQCFTLVYEQGFVFCTRASLAIVTRILNTIGGVACALNQPTKICNANITIFDAYCFVPPLTQRLWIYPLGFDGPSAIDLLNKAANTHHINLTPVNLSTHHQALLVDSPLEAAVAAFARYVVDNFRNRFFLSYNLVLSIQEILAQRGKTVTTAESCTGGLIASMITSNSGSSEVFKGSVVSYDNLIKEKWLGVDAGILRAQGAVSEDVVKAMARGALQLTGANYALAISGIAGPLGGSAQKPVGTVFVSCISQEGCEQTWHLQLQGERNYIRYQASMSAFLLLLHMLMQS